MPKWSKRMRSFDDSSRTSIHYKRWPHCVDNGNRHLLCQCPLMGNISNWSIKKLSGILQSSSFPLIYPIIIQGKSNFFLCITPGFPMTTQLSGTLKFTKLPAAIVTLRPILIFPHNVAFANTTTLSPISGLPHKLPWFISPIVHPLKRVIFLLKLRASGAYASEFTVLHFLIAWNDSDSADVRRQEVLEHHWTKGTCPAGDDEGFALESFCDGMHMSIFSLWHWFLLNAGWSIGWFGVLCAGWLSLYVEYRLDCHGDSINVGML